MLFPIVQYPTCHARSSDGIWLSKCLLLQTEHVLGLNLNLNVLCMFQRYEIRQLHVSPIVLC